KAVDEHSFIEGDVLSNDKIGADGHQDAHALVEWNVSNALLAEIDKYGDLTLNDDGTWSFKLDDDADIVRMMNDSDFKQFELDYTITDGDGDTDNATLRFGIQGKTNTPPEITPVEIVVSEEGLEGGITGGGTTDDASVTGQLEI